MEGWREAENACKLYTELMPDVVDCKMWKLLTERAKNMRDTDSVLDPTPTLL